MKNKDYQYSDYPLRDMTVMAATYLNYTIQSLNQDPNNAQGTLDILSLLIEQAQRFKQAIELWESCFSKPYSPKYVLPWQASEANK